ncbi:MAG: RES family NAD+ phosphorylase [Bdellovibrionales bacterium]|nr:RES family NAD+ phosphorylase [Bdellovibrionales bacterium]
MSSIFEQNFTQWQTLTNVPSNSQWLGFYAFLAGIQAIIYPSIRNPEGYNLAVYPENLRETDSFVELSPALEHVSADNVRMDAKTYSFFANPHASPVRH